MLVCDWKCAYEDEDVPYIFWHVLNSLYLLGGIPRELEDIVLSLLVRQNVIKDTQEKEQKFMEWLSMAIPCCHPVNRIEG